jgi:hypothetical protein
LRWHIDSWRSRESRWQFPSVSLRVPTEYQNPVLYESICVCLPCRMEEPGLATFSKTRAFSGHRVEKKCAVVGSSQPQKIRKHGSSCATCYIPAKTCKKASSLHRDKWAELRRAGHQIYCFHGRPAESAACEKTRQKGQRLIRFGLGMETMARVRQNLTTTTKRSRIALPFSADTTYWMDPIADEAAALAC